MSACQDSAQRLVQSLGDLFERKTASVPKVYDLSIGLGQLIDCLAKTIDLLGPTDPLERVGWRCCAYLDGSVLHSCPFAAGLTLGSAFGHVHRPGLTLAASHLVSQQVHCDSKEPWLETAFLTVPAEVRYHLYERGLGQFVGQVPVAALAHEQAEHAWRVGFDQPAPGVPVTGYCLLERLLKIRLGRVACHVLLTHWLNVPAAVLLPESMNLPPETAPRHWIQAPKSSIINMMPREPISESDQPDFQTPDLHNPEVVIGLFSQATRIGLENPHRKGSCCHMPAEGRLLMTGDLHDHLLNYQRIVRLADLDADKDNHLILHEVIHGEHKIDGRDHSIRMLARVAALVAQYPGQVHVMLGNHELAQVSGADILKGGHSSVELYDQGVDFIFDEDADAVRKAMAQFVHSMLLAVRCPNGVFCSHSLPSPYDLDEFDPQIIDRIPTDEDMAHGGSAYCMVWGRGHTEALAEDLAEDWDTRLFLMGHQPVDFGYELEGNSMIILNSDDNHGVALPIELTVQYPDRAALVDSIVPLASIVV